MADYIVKDTELTSVANAIRTAGGTNSLLSFPNGFVSAVNNISGGGGSSDFSTAEVTVINANSDGGRSFVLPNSDDLDGTPFSPASLGDVYVAKNETLTVTAILYKGKAMTPNAPNYSVTGNASISNGMLIITGDCTITIS